MGSTLKSWERLDSKDWAEPATKGELEHLRSMLELHIDRRFTEQERARADASMRRWTRVAVGICVVTWVVALVAIGMAVQRSVTG